MLDALSRREEEGILKELKKKALKQCDPVVKDFAMCSQGRTVSVTWKCRDQWRNMQDCMRQYMNEEATDEAKLAFLAERKKKA